ncbi:MAG: SLBB domain-containing protein [Balneolales bacterium]|nr:SLBB domain-containing protein [Balneolales bacterium]
MISRFNFAKPGIYLCFLLLPLLYTDLFAQQARNDTDRRSRANVQTGTQLTLPAGDGTFYFIDPIGINLLSERLVSRDAIDITTYRLGPGDMLSISVTGGMNGTFRGIVVNPQGMVTIPNVGSVEVDNLLVMDAREKIGALISSSFRDTETVVSIEVPRYIKVHVTGDVTFPGIHYVPAQSRVDMLLAIALTEQPAEEDKQMIPALDRETVLSGPLATRNIKIQREDEVLTSDLVAYILGGEKDANPILRSGDVVRISQKPTFTPQVSVSGSVNSQFIAEYSDKDTIERLLHMAGGFAFDADESDLFVYRYSFDGIQKIQVEDYNAFQLQPNDRIVVGFDEERRFSQMARVSGEVTLPGIFPIKEGVTTVKDLLEMAGGLTERAQTNSARLIRSRPWSNINELKRTSDQLLEGFEYLDLENSIGNNNVFIDLNNEEQLASVKLFNNDILSIPRTQRSIYVFGQVMNSGYYNFDELISAYDYIGMAGGYALAADPSRVFVIKAGTQAWKRPGETSIEPGDIVFVDREPLESLALVRQEQFHRREIRNRNIQLIFSGLATITSVITAYVAIRRR